MSAAISSALRSSGMVPGSKRRSKAGQGGSDDLRPDVAAGAEVFGDRRGDQFLELGEPGSQVAA